MPLHVSRVKGGIWNTSGSKPSAFSDKANLKKLSLLTAIRSDEGKVMCHIDKIEDIDIKHYFEELMRIFGAAFGLERAHMGLFIQLSVIYAKHNPSKLTKHMKVFWLRINILKKNYLRASYSNSIKISEQDKAFLKAHILQAIAQPSSSQPTTQIDGQNVSRSQSISSVQPTSTSSNLVGSLTTRLISIPPENYNRLLLQDDGAANDSLAESNSKIGRLLHLILKIYKTLITAELPIYQQQNILPWTQLFLKLIRKPLLNSPGFPIDTDDRNRWGWSKAKKWSYFIVELNIENQDWMSKKVICHTIIYFEESIKPKETWTVLKPQIPILLPHFIFKLLCITEDEIMEFENSAEGYIRTQFAEFFEDICSNPSTISAGFLLALASGRKKTIYPAEQTPRDTDGALRSLAHLATVITETKSIRPNIEEFFKSYVFPEFRSEHAFLRARTCEVVRMFEISGAEWSKPELLNTAYQGVTQCLSDPSLPVRVQAALALPELCGHPQVHEGIAPHIGQIMKGLLALSNKVDLDSLTQATQSLVSKFSDELLPFAADMAQALHQSYMRLMSEIADARRLLEDDDSRKEKVLVAMNILKITQQLVVGSEGNLGVLYQVEAASIPLIKYTLKEEIVEIYDEALELLGLTQFALKMITNEQWELFEIIYYDVFKRSGANFIAEMFSS
ncbi:hypothetical protein KEM48_013030 [Puccinia striiformis f. sp. tritici PST-130]|nr:hypothetical protein KEM48_013030 [Puccinia striiformis f. sp. tritici PST-130]